MTGSSRQTTVRAAAAEVERRRDGHLPAVDLDDEDLLGVLATRWTAQLLARLDAVVDEQPDDLRAAVLDAAAGAARALPGAALVLSAHADRAPVATALRRADRYASAAAAGPVELPLPSTLLRAPEPRRRWTLPVPRRGHRARLSAAGPAG